MNFCDALQTRADSMASPMQYGHYWRDPGDALARFCSHAQGVKSSFQAEIQETAKQG